MPPTKPTNRKSFYNKLQNFIKYNEKTILPGSFNMIENIFLGRLGGNPNNTHTIGIQNFICIKNKWRKPNRYKKYFTYHNADNTIHSRSDRIYMTKTMKTITYKMITTPISDHNSVSVTIQVNKKEPKGPGVWKLNSTI